MENPCHCNLHLWLYTIKLKYSKLFINFSRKTKGTLSKLKKHVKLRFFFYFWLRNIRNWLIISLKALETLIEFISRSAHLALSISDKSIFKYRIPVLSKTGVNKFVTIYIQFHYINTFLYFTGKRTTIND